MLIAENNEGIQTLTTERSDQPSGKTILPRRGWCNGLVSNAHGAQPTCDDSSVNLIAIPDHIAWSLIPRKGLGDLTRDPLRCRVGCHVDPDEISAIKPYDDEAIQQLEAEAGHHKKVHGGNVWRVVSQKGR